MSYTHTTRPVHRNVRVRTCFYIWSFAIDTRDLFLSIPYLVQRVHYVLTVCRVAVVHSTEIELAQICTTSLGERAVNQFQFESHRITGNFISIISLIHSLSAHTSRAYNVVGDTCMFARIQSDLTSVFCVISFRETFLRIQFQTHFAAIHFSPDPVKPTLASAQRSRERD